MSKIELPFHLDDQAEFRFALVLESRSVSAHSMMDSGDNKMDILDIIISLAKNNTLNDVLKSKMITWKEKYK